MVTPVDLDGLVFRTRLKLKLNYQNNQEVRKLQYASLTSLAEILELIASGIWYPQESSQHPFRFFLLVIILQRPVRGPFILTVTGRLVFPAFMVLDL